MNGLLATPGCPHPLANKPDHVLLEDLLGRAPTGPALEVSPYGVLVVLGRVLVVLLAHVVREDRGYWGTAMEIMHMATVLVKPVLVVCPNEFEYTRAHPWLTHYVDRWYSNFEEFIADVECGNVPVSKLENVRLAPVAKVDLGEGTLDNFDLHSWGEQQMSIFGREEGLRVIACMPVGGDKLGA